MTFEEWWDSRCEETAGRVNVEDVRAAWDAATNADRKSCARLVADDSLAFSFQTLGQYRTALIKAMRSNARDNPPSVSEGRVD